MALLALLCALATYIQNAYNFERRGEDLIPQLPAKSDTMLVYMIGIILVTITPVTR